MASKIQRLEKVLRKAIIAFLLLFAAFGPSFAEAGHYQDALLHQEQGSFVLTADSDSDASRDQQQRSNPVEKGTHCAFSHCGHVAMAFPDRPVGSLALPASSSVVAAEPSVLVDHKSPGPERPPRA
jgi:hypothetical protein